MELPEYILEQACKSGCPRLVEGNCPFGYSEKDVCLRVREVLRTYPEFRRDTTE